MNRNKRLITLDIGSAAGREIALRLMETSDVVIENFRPGTLERWQLDPKELSERFPRITWVRVSGFGQTGPYRARGGYATVAEAFSGIASITGYADRGPMVSAFPLGDYLAGVFGAFGAMVALHERNKSGRGQIVDVSLYEPFLRIIESLVVRYDQTGQGKPRLGNQMEEDVPRNVYATADGGYIAVSCGSERIFENLLRAIDRLDLRNDSRFADMASRVNHREVIDQIIASWMRQKRTAIALAILEKAEVVAGRVYEIGEVLNDQHVKARAAIAKLIDPILGEMRMPAPVPQMSETPGHIRWSGGSPGEHNQEVYRDLLDLGAEELDELADRGVI
jgi:succinyl-CoA--D-citramalate CoA-transferase